MFCFTGLFIEVACIILLIERNGEVELVGRQRSRRVIGLICNFELIVFIHYVDSSAPAKEVEPTQDLPLPALRGARGARHGVHSPDSMLLAEYWPTA